MTGGHSTQGVILPSDTGVTVYIVPLKIMSPPGQNSMKFVPLGQISLGKPVPYLVKNVPLTYRYVFNSEHSSQKSEKSSTDSLKLLIEQSICALFRYLANLLLSQTKPKLKIHFSMLYLLLKIVSKNN